MEEKIIEDNYINRSIYNSIKKIVNDIEKSEDYEISRNKKHKITKIIEEEIKRDEDECVKIIKKHFIYIPHDEYYKTLLFSLENNWREIDEKKLSPDYQEFTISPEKFIYYDLIDKKSKKFEICTFEIKVEFNLNMIQYINDKNELKTFNYNIDEDIYDDYEEDSENISEEDKTNIETFKEFCDFVIQKIEDCGRFTIMTLSNWNSKKNQTDKLNIPGHRNVILIENTDEEIYFNHYEPHGAENDYFYHEREDFFEILKTYLSKSFLKSEQKKYKFQDFSHLQSMSTFNSSLSLKKNKKSSKKKTKKISIEPFSSSICVGIQSVLSEYDKYGYCSLFSMFWLYCVLNCFFDINEKNKNIPPLKEWIKNVENILLEIFKNNQEKLYNLVITFAYRLFSRYYSSNLLNVNDRNMILKIQEDSVNILFSVYLDDMKSGKIKVYIEEKMEKIDESECDKKTIEKDIIIDDFQEDEGIEIDNTNFDDDEEDRNENVNNLSEEEKRRLLKEYYGEDFDLNIEEIENNENDIVPREYSYEDVNEVPREYDYEDVNEVPREYDHEDVNEVPREYNYEDVNEVPREYNYEDVDEDMTVEFVDEPNQNEY
jgi:hypothetical protein